MSAISPAASEATRGRSSSTRRIVNAFATSVRSRVWSGGSICRMPPSRCTGERRGASFSFSIARENRRSPSTSRASA